MNVSQNTGSATQALGTASRPRLAKMLPRFEKCVVCEACHRSSLFPILCAHDSASFKRVAWMWPGQATWWKLDAGHLWRCCRCVQGRRVWFCSVGLVAKVRHAAICQVNASTRSGIFNSSLQAHKKCKMDFLACRPCPTLQCTSICLFTVLHVFRFRLTLKAVVPRLLQGSVSFKPTIRKHGGEANAHRLAKAWVHRMTFYNKLYWESPDADMCYTNEMIASYDEESEFAEWVASLPDGDNCKATAERLRQIRPSLRPVKKKM